MNRKIKIAYCIPGLYAPGGMERVLTLKANYLADVLGYDVHIILTEEKDKPPYYPLSPLVQTTNLDLDFDRMHSAGPAKRIVKFFYYQYLYKKRMKKALKELRPDITVSTLRREINFITSIKDGSLKVGEIHFSRDNYRNFNDIKAPEAVRRFAARMWMRQLIVKLRRLAKFVVLTNEDREKWVELDNVMCIHNPASFRVEAVSDCSSHTVIAIGRYTYQKGFDLLLPAWKKVSEQHPDWTLQIYGDGDRTSYQAQADSLGIDPATCRLNGTTTEVPRLLSESSIFVLSSRYEGMPMVLGESMACGVPPVAFTCPSGPRDIITDGEDGLLVENGNIDQLAGKLCYLIEHDDERRRMGLRAQENVKRFYIENIMQLWDKLFKSLVS